MRTVIVSFLAGVVLFGAQPGHASRIDGKIVGIHDAAAPDDPAMAVPGGSASWQQLKRHRDRVFGFRFRYPASWIVHAPDRSNARVRVGDGRGASCLVTVLRRPIPADAEGKPYNLDSYLAVLRRKTLESSYRPDFRARITRIETALLGGQRAKRIAVSMVLQGSIPFRAMQYLTWRSYGVVTLTCGARRELFTQPQTQRFFEMVARTFRF